MVLRFCPFCANLLRFREHSSGNRFACPTCPYIYPIRSRISSRIYFTGKERADIIDAESTWMGVDSTDERCPKCSHSRAYFKQLQTRSADEPMTIFYRCCNHECAHTWRVD
ncbi:DNA-directed RNA polymerase III subunit RPC10 [Trachymyrmex septentrionalis]|uniref:DNA-directed RNA polymerase subunit n=1 Tax=Trachymyrmex septentrionalis TaxID=34720 RepID=A0A151JV54_9HYME|nr:DNA-directed RNA polymerase III subunit RPC10 [Trachymyrmex septentrionalis]